MKRRPMQRSRSKSAGTSRYDQFVAEMKAGGFRRLFEDKPVLLRLIAIDHAAVDRDVARIRPAP